MLKILLIYPSVLTITFLGLVIAPPIAHQIMKWVPKKILDLVNTYKWLPILLLFGMNCVFLFITLYVSKLDAILWLIGAFIMSLINVNVWLLLKHSLNDGTWWYRVLISVTGQMIYFIMFVIYLSKYRNLDTLVQNEKPFMQSLHLMMMLIILIAYGLVGLIIFLFPPQTGNKVTLQNEGIPVE